MLGAAVASTVFTLPWLYSKINNPPSAAQRQRSSDGVNPLSQSTSALPEIRTEPHQRDVLFYSGSIIPPNDAVATTTTTNTTSSTPLVTSAEDIEAAKRAAEEGS